MLLFLISILNVQKLILLVGSKLHHIVVKLAVEITEVGPVGEFRQFNLRDELFWFGRPRFLLRIIQFISFQVNLKYVHTKKSVVYIYTH